MLKLFAARVASDMLPSDLSNPRYRLVYMAQEWTV